jgi:5'/3'-nucleotidase SurE
VTERPIDLSNPCILVTNDDGIHAPGLEVLERIAGELVGQSGEVWVVAPDTEQSGASHSLTLTMPLRIRQVSERRYAVRGTPTDCVMMAIYQVMKRRKPTLVLSGVNRGGNLGEDVTYSGTIAAAMEGTLLGVPSIALSQTYLDREYVIWETAARHGASVIKKLCAIGWPEDVLININFPNVEPDKVNGIRLSTQGRRDLSELSIDARVDARGQPYYWLGFRRQREHSAPPGTDLAAVDRGEIAVTPLHLDLTHAATLAALQAALDAR